MSCQWSGFIRADRRCRWELVVERGPIGETARRLNEIAQRRGVTDSACRLLRSEYCKEPFPK